MPSNEYMRQYMAARRANRRQQLLDMAGNKCARCKATLDLEFDHRDRHMKALTLSGAGLDGAWLTILNEFKKCDLLCRSCHKDKTKNSSDIPGGVCGTGKGAPLAHGTALGYIQYQCRCLDCKFARSQHRKGEIAYQDEVTAPINYTGRRGRRCNPR